MCPIATFRRIVNVSYKVPSTVSKEAAHLISKLLQYDPAKRIDLANVRKHPWVVKYRKKEALEVPTNGDGVSGSGEKQQ
jgi:serine/threonine protein kinase